MIAVREIKFNHYESTAPRMIPDGWKPLCTRPGDFEYETILAVLVDTDKTEEAEVFRICKVDYSLSASQGKELAFVGACQDGSYLFLEVEAEEDPDPRGPRRLGRPDW